MKKILFLASLAAVAMTSCTSESNEYVGGNNNTPKEIAFSAFAQPTTRAAADTYQYAIDGTTFPTDLNMYVAAYQVEPTPAGNFFAGTQFIYNNAGGAAGSSAKWGGATAKYWPLSPCYINFLAYANVTGSAAFNATNYASEVVVTQTDNSSAQTDLMYAIGNGEVTQSGNALIFPDKVSMTFYHAQSWIDFYVKGNTTVEQSAIKINSITLKDAYYSGTFTVTHTNYDKKTSQSVNGTWTSPGDNKDVTVPGINGSGQSLTGTYVQAGKGLMVVPNGFTSFVINYSFNGKNYDYEFTPLNTTLEKGKHYIYNINFTLHEIFVEARVEDWTDVNNYVDVPTQAFNYSTTPSVTAGTFTLPSLTNGTYSCTITGLPADTYKVVEKTDDGQDIIDAVYPTSTVTTASAGEPLNISFTVKNAATTNTRKIEIQKNSDSSVLFTLTVAAP